MKKIILFLSIIALFSCNQKQDNLVILRGDAIGTTFTIRYLNPDNKNLDIKIEDIIKKVNKSISTYVPTSDISKINKGDTSIVVDAYFKEVFLKSARIYKETKGEFDPTVGVLVNAWGFGPGKRIENMDSTKVKELLKYVGFDKVSLKNNKISKQYPQTYFDFNAIAKGYLVDLVGRMFENNKIPNYMVEIGGEIRARGINQLGTPWRIAIENPNTDGTRSINTNIKLLNESIATSGNYRKFRIAKNGKKYVHTINPLTGFATPSNLLSASVISKSDCADVDGYATAFMAMGFEKAKTFLKNHPELKAFLIYADDNNKMKTYKTPNFTE
ncbi:FAD:protein FMN transferase [Lutibacter sp.]|uniref:FAD:protein FMN transferase n=1 Tax=Lutibacter sp. TaxID=1925666 RepID=UPI0025C308D5|nr:FAD:protein FMN transferase [Lutibacter sp.]MCF6181310.1 FAD:protein FMN transferase [Lutibacter sp.]